MDSKDFLNRKRFVLIHHYVETGHNSIIAFSDSFSALQEVRDSHPRFGSSCHYFYIVPNNLPLDVIRAFDPDGVQGVLCLNDIKDFSLINICKNVADFLSVGEYAMLKKSYFKSASWFEKAKNSAFLGAEILDNY